MKDLIILTFGSMIGGFFAGSALLGFLVGGIMGCCFEILNNLIKSEKEKFE